jgi:RHS repeat-associated protein
VTDPNGTITREIFDGQHRELSTWVGTDDTPTTGWWSPTNNAGANMTEVSSNVYDNGGIGDGNLTETIQYPTGTTNPRVTQIFYDWRDRQVAAKAGVILNTNGTENLSAENDGTNRPITYTVLDNAGEAIEQDTYDGDGVAVTTTDGVPNAPSASLLRSKSDTEFDDQGRPFETQQFSVNSGNGTVSSTALTGQTFYDHRGDEIATESPTGLWTKNLYDGAGRDIETYTDDGGVLAGATINWTNANSVTNDVVLSQDDMTYDGDGNVIETADHERLAGDSQTAAGPLGNAAGTGGPAADVYYETMYYDNADRATASVNVGTNGGSAYTRTSTIPTSTDSTLVSSTAYGANGMPSITTDPRGIEALTEYNLLGETTETIAAYTDGTPTADTNQATLYTYDGNGDETSMTAVMPSGEASQTTDWIYGVAGGMNGIFSNDLLGKVEYPDATTGAASTSASNDVTYTDDALGEVTSMTDQNGTTHDYVRDLLGRETLDSVTTLGSGVDGTVRALGTTFNSQGLPALETSYSNANGTGVVNQDEDVYNGLGQLTGEYQSVSGAVNTSSTPEVQYAFSDPSLGSRQTSETYPNGRVIDDVYNSGIDTTIGRVSSIADAAGSAAGNLQAYSYQGVGTIIGYIDGNGLAETTTLDSFGRDAEIKYVSTDAAGSPTTDDFAYGYDQDGNVLYQDNLLNGNFSQLYHANSSASGDDNSGYDPLDRLTGFEQGTLSASGNNGSTLDTVASPAASQSFNLNAVGDQNSVTTGNATVTNSTNAKNELTTNGNSTLTFDNNGNTLTDENGLTYTFDAWNHEATLKSGNTTIADYANDPTGRRVTETSGNTTTAIYFSNQWQPIELRQGGNVTSQNVFGLGYVNQLVERDDNTSSGNLGKSGSGLGVRLYAQQDLNWSTTTLVDNSGNVVQRMVYLPDGGVRFYTASWAAGTNTAALRSLYQGGWLETANGDFAFDYRDYDPATGTWKEPDPAGYANGADREQMELSSPTNRVDPAGLFTGALAGAAPAAAPESLGGVVAEVAGETVAAEAPAEAAATGARGKRRVTR